MSEKRILAVATSILAVLGAIAVYIALNVPESASRQERLVLAFATVVPIALVIAYYARQAAKFPPRPIRRGRNANAFMYVGFALEYFGVGLFQPGINLGLAGIAVGFVLFLWGSIRFSKAKGYPAWLGALLGLTSIFGFLILMVIPDRTLKTEQPNQSP